VRSANGCGWWCRESGSPSPSGPWSIGWEGACEWRRSGVNPPADGHLMAWAAAGELLLRLVASLLHSIQVGLAEMDRLAVVHNVNAVNQIKLSGQVVFLCLLNTLFNGSGCLRTVREWLGWALQEALRAQRGAAPG
jgi:hypothetical protein